MSATVARCRICRYEVSGRMDFGGRTPVHCSQPARVFELRSRKSTEKPGATSGEPFRV